jgi:hypothetical protein
MNGPVPEAGCNCEHLADSARCHICQQASENHDSNPIMWAAMEAEPEDVPGLNDSRLEADGGRTTGEHYGD